MSTTGNDQVGQATAAAHALLLMRRSAIGRVPWTARCSSTAPSARPAYRSEDTELRDKAARAFDRAFDPQGVARQLAAAMSTSDRTEDLRRLDLPSLVIHGAEDPLIAVSGGQATAEAITGAELVVIDGMGHDLPKPLWRTVAERIAALVARTERQRGKTSSTSVSQT